MGSIRDNSLAPNRANGSARSLLPGRGRKPQSGEEGRRHIDESLVQRAAREAVRTAGIVKRATCHTDHHSVARLLLEACYDIRPGQELLGHQDVRTMISTPVLNRANAVVER